MKNLLFFSSFLAIAHHSLGIAENYECKFSVSGAVATANFDGRTPINNLFVNNFHFSVHPITLDLNGNKLDGITITAISGTVNTAVAPMGVAVIALINETYKMKASCKLLNT